MKKNYIINFEKLKFIFILAKKYLYFITDVKLKINIIKFQLCV